MGYNKGGVSRSEGGRRVCPGGSGRMSEGFDWTTGVVAIIGRRKSGLRGPVGTGFVVSDDGLIVTCVHVLDQTEWHHGKWADPVEVRFKANGRYAHPLVVEKYFNRKLDLAILALQSELPEDVVTLPLANPMCRFYSINKSAKRSDETPFC